MASRNLTDKFSEFRAARQRRPSAGSAGEAGGAGLLSADDGIAHQGSWQDVRNMLPPAWVDTVEEIEADMSEMDKKMVSEWWAWRVGGVVCVVKLSQH
mmetsp:Transcript_54799/g.151069  ORF Transcript_54799/g.151069 Transcript_54799/m.151069 type:complete len:98 (+) Transcript_54799:202-495(+)